MPKKKNGNYYLIDKIDEFSFIQVNFENEERPLYKVYKNNKPVDYWRSDENVHEMSDDQIANSADYNKFLDLYMESHPDVETDIFGLPQDSKLGTAEGNREMNTSSNKSTEIPKAQRVARYNPYGDDDDYSFGSYYRGYSGAGYNSYYQPKPEVEDKEKVAELTKSNTIVFHLEDPSTVMLGQIYEGKGYDVVRHRLNTPTVKSLMEKHERIICLGHGSGYGLIGMFGPEVRECFAGKKIFTIWCNTDAYFNAGKVGQGAFITGNMPSEVWECRAAGCGNISRELMLENITYWSKLCADVVENCLDGNVRESVNYIRREYIKKYGDHPVTHYNAVRTFVLGDTYEEAEQQVKVIEDELGIHPDWAKYNETTTSTFKTPNQDREELNDNIRKGIDWCVNKIRNQIDTINGKNTFDLKTVGSGDTSLYNYIGKLIIEKLEKIYPELTFTLDVSIISWV